MRFNCLICLFTNVNILMFPLVRNIEIPDIIYELCPHSDICNRNASRTVNNKNQVPCCTSCGCDEDCGLRLDCCFDHLDKYKLIDRGILACIDHEIRNENETKPSDFIKGYTMVQTCNSEDITMKEDDDEINHCRRKDQNGNSLIAPVSSLDKSTIYINEACAACNGVDMTSIKQWDYLIQFNSVPKESTVTDIRNNLETDYGKRTYYIPPMGENWFHKTCYSNFMEAEACPEISALQNYSTLCQNLNSLFYYKVRKELYRNVFCALCSTPDLPINRVNKECGRNFGKGIKLTIMTMMIKDEVMKASKSFDTSSTVDVLQARSTCPLGHVKTSKNMCISTDCPEGMLRTHDGCKYFALIWYPVRIVMQVKLVPTKGTARLAITHLLSYGTIGSTELLSPSSWLQIPCRQAGLTDVLIYYSSVDSTANDKETAQYITSLVVLIYKIMGRPSAVYPAVIMPRFHKCVSEKWIAKLGNETYIFDPHFDKYIGYIQDGIQKLKTTPGDETEEIARPALYKPLKSYPKLNIGKTALKKPFFCDQVRVPITDVDIKFGEIHIISKNITLGTNEYVVNIPGYANAPVLNMTTFSVCIEDYNISDRRASSGTKYLCSQSEAFIKVFLLSFSLTLMAYTGTI